MLFIFLGISYVMILQYLISVPEIFQERPILNQERTCCAVRPSSYVASLILTDVLRAVVHSLLFFVVSYWIVGLNPQMEYVLYTLSVTCLGVFAFQAVIDMCSAATDDMGTVYTYIFLLLAVSSVFGGLCIPFQNIRLPFKPFYFLSIPAWAYRGILVNDLACCHLNVDCADAYEMMATSEAKEMRDAAMAAYSHCDLTPGLNDTETGGIMPLGQFAIIGTQLSRDAHDYAPTKRSSVFALVFFIIVCRFLAILIYRERTRREGSLRLVDEATTKQELSEVPPLQDDDVVL